LLAKKGWKRQANLRRFVWRHPLFEFHPADEAFFAPLLTDLGLPMPEGHFWKQPGLESIQFGWGDCATVARNRGGLRLFECQRPDLVGAWAAQHQIRWMDAVCRWNDPMARELLEAGWTESLPFPWFLNPLDLDRKVELNLYSETGLPLSFLFKRQFSDIGRVGQLPM
jgi:hypothetical protein